MPWKPFSWQGLRQQVSATTTTAQESGRRARTRRWRPFAALAKLWDVLLNCGESSLAFARYDLPAFFRDPAPRTDPLRVLLDVVMLEPRCLMTAGISVNPMSGLTTTEAGGQDSFAVVLNDAPTDDVTIGLHSSNTDEGTLSVGNLVFTTGNWNTAQTVTVTGADDSLDDGDVGYSIVLEPAVSNDANYDTMDGDDVTLSNTDNDPEPTITITGVTANEGNSGTTNFTFAVTLSHGSTQTITVNFQTQDCTALTADGDYSGATSTLTFDPTEVSKNITISVAGDTKDENDETFKVVLSSPNNASLATVTEAVGTITNDDSPPTIGYSAAGFTVGEGSGPATINLTLSQASGKAVTVTYATSEGSATTLDYTPVTDSVVFAPGETLASFTVPITDDDLDEPDEVLSLVLSSPTNGTLAAAGTAPLTITDNDAAPDLSFSGASVVEGDTGTTALVFTVNLSAASGKTVTVAYATSTGMGAGTAAAGTDFTGTTGVLTFAPNTTEQTVAVPVLGDLLDEVDETLTLGLSSPSNAGLATSQQIGTIIDDDGPTVGIAGSSVTEGNSGPAGVTFAVTLSASSPQTVYVPYGTADGDALETIDYEPASGTLTFTPGQTSQDVVISAIGDTTDETDESFSVTLGTVINGSGGGGAVGTIIDDDGPTVNIADATTVTEGDSATFAVTLSASSPQTVYVPWATVDGTAGTLDYTPASGTLTFTTGQTSQDIVVSTTGDSLDEDDVDFSVTLADLVNATADDATGVATIVDDDAPVAVDIGSPSGVMEGDSGSTPVTFTVSLSQASGKEVVVAWSTSDFTTSGSADYTGAGGTLTFEPGETTKTVVVNVLGDVVDESDESFAVSLSSPTNATLGTSPVGTGTIIDDDPIVYFQVGSYTVTEDVGYATVTVVLNGASDQTVTVLLTSSDGSANSSTDYASQSVTLTFAPTESSKIVTVAITADETPEGNESFFLNLSSPSNADLGPTPTATVTIYQQNSISGQIYEDDIGDGENNSGDVGLEGWTVFLDTATTTGAYSTVTDGDGEYTFSNLPPGTYTVREVLATTDWMKTTTGSLTFSVSDGQGHDVDIGNFERITISGMKFRDNDRDGVHDGGEPGLYRWKIYLDDGDETFVNGEPLVHTDVDGSYTFANLGPGTYFVREFQINDWVQTTDDPNIVAHSGTDMGDVDFGNYMTNGPAMTPDGSCPGGCSKGTAPSLIKIAAGLAKEIVAVIRRSMFPVRYFDGSALVVANDLGSDGVGLAFGHSRTWTNRPVFGPYQLSPHANRQGYGWVTSFMPWLMQDGDEVAVVTGVDNSRFFDWNGTGYDARYFGSETLVHDSGSHEFVFTDSTGTRIAFHDFSGSVAAGQRGQLKSVTDALGNVTEVTSANGDGTIAEIQRTDSESGLIESYVYTYGSSGGATGMITSVTLRRKPDEGSWSTVRSVEYAYYGTSDANGNNGDLKTATIKDATGAALDITYYRYYKPDQANGYEHGLKFVVKDPSFARLDAAVDDPFTASDGTVATYADHYFEYDGYYRVTKEVAQGEGCSTCSGGQGTFLFNYATSTHADGFNNWKYKTVETLPDGNQNIVYTNAYGDVLLKIFKDTTTNAEWKTFYNYDAQGRLVLVADPSAVSSYNDSYADLLHMQEGYYEFLRNNAGLVTTYTYWSSTTATDTTAGGVEGYQLSVFIQKGEQGDLIKQSKTEYYLITEGDVTVAPVATETVYRDDGGTEAITTSYSYTFFTDTTQIESTTVTHPIIGSAQNGSEVAAEETVFYDSRGRMIWARDAAGILSYFSYDVATGALVKVIQDVDTCQDEDFTALPDGWETLAEGAGLHLITEYEVDGLGRTTRVTDPNGTVSYTVYLDAAHQVRSYAAWDTVTDRPTGPTVVSRRDRPGSYVEVLTTAVAPHLTGDRPDGTEAIGDVLTLARNHISSGGQVTSSDAYFDLDGVTYSTSPTLGTEGDNYYRTLVDYGNRGWIKRQEAPTGTIARTVHDSLGRTTEIWVGLDDTPTTGFWSPTNNAGADMVKVGSFVFDAGGIGDGNLTQETVYPGGGADNRVTQHFYDWRNRLVATKGGVQGSEGTGVQRSIVYFEYDNLGQMVAQEVYDGDNVTITDGNSDGVPDKPSSSLRRVRSTVEYDDWGRAFRTHVFSVDPSDGSVSADSLTTELWFDQRGNLIKSSAPGGLVSKVQYDSLARVAKQFTTDGGGDADWDDAGTVTGDAVLEQVEFEYDDASNVILTTVRQRFHDEADTGELGTPVSGVNARVYFTASYYDKANRLTDQVNVGTDGDGSYTRPPTPDGRSDSVLVTSYGYRADEVQKVTLTGSPTGGTFTLTYSGQTTSGIAYNASAAAVQIALEALSNIDSGDVLVFGEAGGPWTVQFTDALGGLNVGALTANGSGLTGGTAPAVAIATVTHGGETGRLQQVTDPRGIVGRTEYDDLGRTVRTIEAFVNGVPSNGDDRITEYAYDGNSNLLMVKAVLPGDAVQETRYVYAARTGSGSAFNSNDILTETHHPDATTGAASSSEKEVSKVNALGQRVTAADRNGNVHAYAYDVLGRLLSDTVTTLGTEVDGAVRRIDIAYDTAGRAFQFTSFEDTAGVEEANQVLREFNGLGQLIAEYQEHDGTVSTETSPVVEYAYSEMAESANHSRLVSMTYPDGRVLEYNYASGLDNNISRLTSLSDNSGTLEAFAYLGLGTVVRRAHPEPDVDLTYIKLTEEDNGDAGDKYIGLDRFGRVEDQRWIDTGTDIETDRFQYGYDRNSNRLYRENLVNAVFSELYHASGSANGYDLFNQLTGFERGELNGPKDEIDGSPSLTQGWSLDAMGNWNSLSTDGTPESRTHNAQNELTGVGGNTLTYDANGNMTTDETGRKLIYDAWNRLVEVQDDEEETLVRYEVDALTRRISETVEETTTVRYYSAAWQVLEEQVDGDAVVQYVWSPVYVDALVLRDRNTDECADLDERLYVQQDANWNVTAVIDEGGTVQERFVYTPFGEVAYLEADWDGLGSSGVEWLYGHQGGRLENLVGVYNFRMRDMSFTLGRWNQNDPIGFNGGSRSLYTALSNNPTSSNDSLGLQDEPNRIVNLADPFNINKKFDEANKKFQAQLAAIDLAHSRFDNDWRNFDICPKDGQHFSVWTKIKMNREDVRYTAVLTGRDIDTGLGRVKITIEGENDLFKFNSKSLTEFTKGSFHIANQLDIMLGDSTALEARLLFGHNPDKNVRMSGFASFLYKMQPEKGWCATATVGAEGQLYQKFDTQALFQFDEAAGTTKVIITGLVDLDKLTIGAGGVINNNEITLLGFLDYAITRRVHLRGTAQQSDSGMPQFFIGVSVPRR